MSLTDREKQMIRGYLPHRRDESLGFGEYYWLDYCNKVQKVYVCTILPDRYETLYGLRYSSTGNIVHVSGDYAKNGVPFSRLYDNKADCKNQTHIAYDDWEHLRKRADDEGWCEYEDAD